MRHLTWTVALLAIEASDFIESALSGLSSATLIATLAIGFLSSSAATTAALPRATADRPDDRPGAQIHVLYVLPNDGADQALDTNGTIAASVRNFQTWLKGQTGGYGMRLDTSAGELDVSFVRLTDSDAQLADRGVFMRDAIEAGTRAAGFADPDKVYAAYYGGSNTAACGGGAWPPTLLGNLAALYVKATYGAGLPCYEPARSTAGLQLMDFAMLHETLHTLGFVATCAPHETRSGHVSDSPTDLMYAGDQPWTPQVLDFGRDDYFGANRQGCLDLTQSGYYEGFPAPPVPPSVVKYALFALGNVTLQKGVRAVDGDVGSNNGTATVGKNVRVTGAVVGRTIKLRKGALPDSLFCLLLQGAPSTATCQAVTLPVVNAPQLPRVQVVPGTTAIRIPKGGSTSPIPAGAYGDVRVAPRGVLVLAGGTYVFKSIHVNPRGQLLCAAACQIDVADRVRIRSRAVLGGTGGTRAEAIRVNIARTSGKPVFAADNRSNVAAVVYAPGGRIELRNRGNYVGAFVGENIKVGQGALVQARRP
jgi:hypothetical protein